MALPLFLKEEISFHRRCLISKFRSVRKETFSFWRPQINCKTEQKVVHKNVSQGFDI